MKKTIFLLAVMLLLVFCIPVSAMAADLPGGNAQEWNLSDPESVLPLDVFRDPDSMEIRKVYELAVNVDPGQIPRDSFERDNIMYECTDILREVVIGDETKTLTETETVESSKNDMDTILSLLPESKEVLTEDGFFGVLLLRSSTIKSEASGYGSSSKTVSISRSYPNLSDADTQYIPKTVDEGGVTYTLADVQWQSDNTYNVDDYEIANRYTANVTYSGSKTSSYVKGYVITADYVGEVCRTGVSNIRYTVIFSGTPIPEPEPIPEPTTEPVLEPITEPETDYTWALIVLPLLAAAITLLISTYINRKKRKELPHYAQTQEYDYDDAYPDSDADVDGNSGDGDGER